MNNTKKTPAQAHYATKAITPVMVEYIAYIEAETGYKVDPMSVQLSSLLRGSFQKSPANQSRLAAQKAKSEADRKARIERKLNTPARKTPAPKVAAKPAAKAPVKRSPKAAPAPKAAE